MEVLTMIVRAIECFDNKMTAEASKRIAYQIRAAYTDEEIEKIVATLAILKSASKHEIDESRIDENIADLFS
jgi:hypothetical protein